MSNPIIMSSKLRLRKIALEEMATEIKTLQERSDVVLKAIDDVEDDSELEPIELEIGELEKELATKLEEEAALKEEIAQIEAAIEESNRKTPKKGVERKMKTNIEVRDGIKAYVQSKGSQRDGFTTVEGGALIPVELLTPTEVLVEELDLTKHVNSVKVNSGGGKYPVIAKSNSKMLSVAELAANPELAKPTITDVAYDIATYRGYIPVSQEMIDDADYDVTGLIADEINDQSRNTKNAAIAAIFKTATAKAATGLDGLKAVFNKDLKRIYTPAAIITSSLFNELDTTKDLNGRYLLQDDITVASGKKLFGHEVIVMDDDVIGSAANDLKGFIGDSKAFMTFFDRNQASVKWTDNNVYGELLASFVRFDAKATDLEAGFYITYTPETPVV